MAGGSDEFRDRRHGIVQCCCSSFTRQCCFATIPLFVLTVILFGINAVDHFEKKHTATTVTVSSGNAVAHLVREVLQSHVDRVGSMTQLVKNKVWTDPYSIDEFLQYAFPVFGIDTTLHRVGVTHNDAGNSFIAVSDLTVALTEDRDPFASVTQPFKPFTTHVREIAEVQARLFRNGVLSRYGREFKQSRTSKYVALEQPQKPAYGSAVNSPWVHVGYELLLERTATGANANRSNWGMWLPPNHTYVHTEDDGYARPALVFIAPIAGRELEWGGQVIGRAVVRDRIFDALFDATSERVTVAYLIDWTTNIIVASSTGVSGTHFVNVPELNAFRTELMGAPEALPIREEPDGRSPYPMRATRLGLRFASFFLVTFADGNNDAMHEAAVRVVDTAFEACVRLAESVRYQAQSGALVDLQDIPHVELALGGAFESARTAVGDLFLGSRLNHSVHRLHLPTTDAPTAVVESWWPTDGMIPIRRYGLTQPGSDVGARMLMRNRWVDITEGTNMAQTNPAEVLDARHRAANAFEDDDNVRLSGPSDEIGRFCLIPANCRFTYMTFSSCATWPLGAVGTGTAVGMRDGSVANRSCFHLQFGTTDIANALHGMRLDLVGLTVVAFDDGTVVAAAGESIPYGTRFNGSARVWDVVPAYTDGNWALLQSLPYGDEAELDGRHFVLHRVNVPATSAKGNLVILTMIEDKVSDSVRRDVTVYAIDLVVVLCLALFLAHFVYFVQHMRSMGRIACIVDAAAELQTEALPEEALRVSSTNKDVESMLISAVQLFLHMKQIRGCLPQAVVDAHRNSGRIADAATIAAAGGGGGEGGDGANTGRPIASRSAGAASRDGQAAVFSNLQNQRQFNLTRQTLTFVSLLFPSTKYMSSPEGTEVFKACEKAASRNGGRHWITDAHLLSHFYFDGDFLSSAIGVAKTFAAAAPRCVVIVTREEATFGLIAADQDKSFAMFGPVVDNAQRMGATAREILGCGESAARAAEVAPLSSTNDARKTAPVLIDRTTLLRSDPSCTEGAIARTVAGLKPDTNADRLHSIHDVAKAVGEAEPISILGLQGAPEENALIIRELLLLRNEESSLDETQKLLWTAIGDAAAALVEGRRADAGSLLQVITQHTDAARGAFVGCRWDQALQAAIAVNMR